MYFYYLLLKRFIKTDWLPFAFDESFNWQYLGRINYPECFTGQGQINYGCLHPSTVWFWNHKLNNNLPRDIVHLLKSILFVFHTCLAYIVFNNFYSIS